MGVGSRLSNFHKPIPLTRLQPQAGKHVFSPDLRLIFGPSPEDGREKDPKRGIGKTQKEKRGKRKEPDFCLISIFSVGPRKFHENSEDKPKSGRRIAIAMPQFARMNAEVKSSKAKTLLKFARRRSLDLPRSKIRLQKREQKE